jgi:DNA-binding response OmpR family regulator
MRILIVEDDPAAAQMMEDALTRAGHQPVSYGHGGLALGAIVRGNFELLISDLMLPNTNGVEVIKMIRGQFPYLPVIVVSALDPIEWEVLCRKAGATCFLQKPLRMERLMREVKLVEQSQVKLDVGIIDGDKVHSGSLARQLGSMGCTVREWTAFSNMLASEEVASKLSVLLVDSTLDAAPSAIKWANGKSMAVVAFQADSPEFDQDKLMRLGASFCLAKPVDAVSLVTQARFFVAPSGGMGF